MYSPAACIVMKRKIISIINPVSGTGSKKELRQLIEKRNEENNIPFTIYPSAANGDYSFLHNIIREQKITDVVIAGGDGTMSCVVGSLLDFDLNFGIIPCGSGKGLAFTAKIPRQYSKALDIIFQGAPTLVDGFFLNGHFACMLAGLGFDAKVAHAFARQSKRGLTNYIKLVVRNFYSAKTFPFTIQLSQTVFETDAFFISIANSNQFGNNFTIAPKASLKDGLLDIVIVTKRNKLTVLFQTLKQLTGANRLQMDSAIDQEKAVIYFQTQQLKIFNSLLAPLHIDGEPAETTQQLDIKVKKKCFRLIQL